MRTPTLKDAQLELLTASWMLIASRDSTSVLESCIHFLHISLRHRNVFGRPQDSTHYGNMGWIAVKT
jgi:hypothetical protein